MGRPAAARADYTLRRILRRPRAEPAPFPQKTAVVTNPARGAFPQGAARTRTEPNEAAFFSRHRAHVARSRPESSLPFRSPFSHSPGMPRQLRRNPRSRGDRARSRTLDRDPQRSHRTGSGRDAGPPAEHDEPEYECCAGDAVRWAGSALRQAAGQHPTAHVRPQLHRRHPPRASLAPRTCAARL